MELIDSEFYPILVFLKDLPFFRKMVNFPWVSAQSE